MADLFLTHVANTPDTVASQTRETNEQTDDFLNNQWDASTYRENELRTPLTFRINDSQNDDFENQTLSWIRSLPSPAMPFEDFDEISMQYRNNARGIIK